MSRIALAAAAITVTVVSGTAGAECFARRPGDTPQCPGAQARSIYLPPVPEQPQTAGDRTHVAFAPTGSTLSEGDVQYQLHELVWNRLSYGLTDRLEIAADFAYVFAGLGARLQLTSPDSPFKLTVGAGMFGGIGVAGKQGSVTAGYHGEQVMIYGSASAFLDGDDDPTHLFLGQAGIAGQVSDRSVLTAYVGRFAMADRFDVERLHAVGAGYKYLGDRWDIDVGMVVPVDVGNRERVVLPMVSFTYRN